MNIESINSQIKDIQVLSVRQEEMFNRLCNCLNINDNDVLVNKWFDLVFNKFGDFDKLVDLTKKYNEK